MGKKRVQAESKALSTGAKAGAGYYVACLGEAAALGPVAGKLRVPGVDPTDECQLITSNGLAAVFCGVALSEFGEAALETNISNIDWVADKGTRHERIVQTFAEHATVVPLRFGTVFLSEDRIREFLERHHDAIAQAIHTLEGREEWGMNLYANRDVLAEAMVSRDPSLKELSQKIASASPGQAYLLTKGMEGSKREAARDEVNRVIGIVLDGMSSAADGSLQLGILKYSPVPTSTLAGRFAFLVRKSHFDRFRERAEELARDYNELGFSMELTGPMPPYNFVDELKD
ncbi:MAG TPA: GvpL/GvpF family gas vesicle protein [Blastocatellia bacterium]